MLLGSGNERVNSKVWPIARGGWLGLAIVTGRPRGWDTGVTVVTGGPGHVVQGRVDPQARFIGLQ